MGKFDKYSGKIVLDVDGDKWEVCPTNKQIAKLLAIDKDKAKSESGFVGLTDALIDIFVKAYPNEDKVKIEAFVMKFMDVIMTELVIKMGWSTKEELEKAAKEELGKASQ